MCVFYLFKVIKHKVLVGTFIVLLRLQPPGHCKYLISNASLHRNIIICPCCSIKTSHLHVCLHHSAVHIILPACVSTVHVPVILLPVFRTELVSYKQTSSLQPNGLHLTLFQQTAHLFQIFLFVEWGPLCSLSCAAVHEAECFHTDSLLCFFHPITSCHTVTCAVLHGKCVSRALEINAHMLAGTHTHTLSLSRQTESL